MFLIAQLMYCPLIAFTYIQADLRKKVIKIIPNGALTEGKCKNKKISYGMVVMPLGTEKMLFPSPVVSCHSIFGALPFK